MLSTITDILTIILLAVMVAQYPRRGGMLTGDEIHRQIKKGCIKISDYNPAYLNPNSYNVQCGDTIMIYDKVSVFDLKDPETFKNVKEYKIPEDGFIMRPGTLYLIPTKQCIDTPFFIPLITGRSSIGRLGMAIHQEAGFGDIGFHGRWTFQIKVTYPTKIYAGQSIGQVYFITPSGSKGMKYHGRYQGSEGPASSRWTSD